MGYGLSTNTSTYIVGVFDSSGNLIQLYGPGGVPLNLTTGTTITGILYGNGSTVSAAVASNFPTLNQNTTGTAASATSAIYATNLAGGANGSVPYQSGGSSTSFLAPGTAGQVLQSNGSAAPTWANATAGGTVTNSSVVTTNGFAGTIANPTTTPAITIKTTVSGILYGNGTGVAAAVAGNFPTLNQSTTGNAATATNLAGGAAGDIIYQSGSATTSFLAAGTSGYLLQSNGSSAPSWVPASTSGTVTHTSGALTSGQIVLGNGGNDVETAGWSVVGTASQTYTFPSASDTVVTLAATQTQTNKRITARVSSTTSNSATYSVNTDNYDGFEITGQSTAITGITLTGTPTQFQEFIIAITCTGTTAIALGSSFEASTVALPTTTSGTAKLTIGTMWNTATSKWRVLGVA